MGRLYLLRHAESKANDANRDEYTLFGGGETDSPLSPAGRKQAEALRGELGAIHFDRILSSPLLKARETLEITLPKASPEIFDALVERRLGKLSGLTREEIIQRFPELEGELTRDPKLRKFRESFIEAPLQYQIESYTVVAARLRRWVREVLEKQPRNSSTLIVSHKHILRCLLYLLLSDQKTHQKAATELEIPNATPIFLVKNLDQWVYVRGLSKEPFSSPGVA